MPTNQLPSYQYRGARALVLLHEKYIRSFLATWKQAKSVGIVLPETHDPDYASMEALLAHILRAARGYMVWMCEQLSLPDPEIHSAPTESKVAASGEAFLEHLLERWQTPLAEIAEELFHEPSYPLRSGGESNIEARLEHAVMHPMRHEFQLQELMGSNKL